MHDGLNNGELVKKTDEQYVIEVTLARAGLDVQDLVAMKRYDTEALQPIWQFQHAWPGMLRYPPEAKSRGVLGDVSADAYKDAGNRLEQFKENFQWDPASGRLKWNVWGCYRLVFDCAGACSFYPPRAGGKGFHKRHQLHLHDSPRRLEKQT